MVNKAIKPILEKKGYQVKVVEFSDYIQPNLALANGDLDANLFQHKIYMENFAKENNLDLSEVIVVPTAPMGIYSKKFKSFIKLDPAANPLTVSEKDIKENVKNLQFKPIEAGQLPRAVESVDLAAVPGNFALAAKMNLLDALVLEKMPDQYRNRVVVNTKDLNKQFVKDIKEAVESEEFEKVIDEQFKGFGKPEWMLKRKQ